MYLRRERRRAGLRIEFSTGGDPDGKCGTFPPTLRYCFASKRSAGGVKGYLCSIQSALGIYFPWTARSRFGGVRGREYTAVCSRTRGPSRPPVENNFPAILCHCFHSAIEKYGREIFRLSSAPHYFNLTTSFLPRLLSRPAPLSLSFLFTSCCCESSRIFGVFPQCVYERGHVA